MGSWIPITPEKPIPSRSHPIAVDLNGNLVGRANLQELNGCSNGYAEEVPPHWTGWGQNMNPNGQGIQNGGYYGFEEGQDKQSRVTDHFAVSFHNDSTIWEANPLAKLLLMQNSAFIASANSNLNTRVNTAANRPLIPNTPPQIDSNQRDSMSVGLLLGNQNQHSCFNQLSDLANGPLIPDMNSYGGVNQRDSDTGFFLRSQNQFFGSNSSSNFDILSQTPQHGFTTPQQPQYDLNFPLTEEDGSPSVTNTFQFTPITPDQDKKLMTNQISATLIVSRNESSSKEKQTETLVTTLVNEAPQQRSDELLQSIVESSSAAISTEDKDKTESKGSNGGIDLNKTPPQKPPRRRKHRPKVITEGKRKRIPKPATPKNTEEKPTGKRKYVRKNVRKESVTELGDAPREITDLNEITAAKSCKRALNFDSDKTRDETLGKPVGQQEFWHGNKRAFTLSSDSQTTELCFGTYSLSGTKSAVQEDQGSGFTVEYWPPGTVSNLTPSMNQLPTDCRSLQENQAAAVSLPPVKDVVIEYSHVTGRNKDKGHTDTCQNRCINGYTAMQQQIHAEGLGKVVFQAKTNHESSEKDIPESTSQPVPKFSSDSRAVTGPKRDHICSTKHMHPSTNSLMGSLSCQSLSYEFHITGQILGKGFSEAFNKKRTESELITNISGVPCLAQVEDGSGEDETRCINHDSVNGFTTKTNHGRNYFDSYKIAERGSGANKYTTERYNHSLAARDYLPAQQILSEPHLNTEWMEETNGLSPVHSFPSQAAIEDHRQPPPPPLKPASEMEKREVVQTSHVQSLPTEQILGRTPPRSVSSGRKRVLKNQDASYDYPKPTAKRRGRPPKAKIHLMLIDEITCRLNGLNLNEGSTELVRQEQNALVVYKGDGALIPHAGTEFIKKLKPRPKVDLDQETNRIWNLLMGKEGSQSYEETDKEKEKWWEEERRVFHGRTDSFIARMHLIQGDRRFSRWKGSVVDSVIGVFLTQNVSDHLSSSAFMSLAARFPLKSASNNIACHSDGTNMLFEESEICTQNEDDAIRWHKQVSSQPNESSMTQIESADHQRNIETSVIERCLVEAHCQSLEEEVISSQDSFDSSIIQGMGEPRSCSGSNSEEEDFIAGFRTSDIQFPTLTNLLQMEKTTFQEFYSHDSCSLMGGRPRFVHKQFEHAENTHESRVERAEDLDGTSTFTYSSNADNIQMQEQRAPSCNHHLHMIPDYRVPPVKNFEAPSEESISPWPATDFGLPKAKDSGSNGFRTDGQAESTGKSTVQENITPRSQETPRMDPQVRTTYHSMHQESNSLARPHSVYRQPSSQSHQLNAHKSLQVDSLSCTGPVEVAEAQTKKQNNTMQHVPSVLRLGEDANERISPGNKQINLTNSFAEPNSVEQVRSYSQASGKTSSKISKVKKGETEGEKKSTVDWDSLRKQVQANGKVKERSKDTQDSLDYEAVRCAKVGEISDAIKERGMNNMLAQRIKEFLDRLVREHGSIDLEWLRDVSPDKAKDYLLSIRGLGLKSVECVRLLTLHHLAFPVDTNVGRIAVRLGWVPLQPLPESLQLHLLELYPILESIQKYLWPRLCKLDQRTLYELHYQLITFGKVFCTKSKPNCNACPMRGECRHFASAFASARLALPGPEDKSIVSSTVPIADKRNPAVVINPMLLPQPENESLKEAGYKSRECEPIIEEPATPEQECPEISESDIEDSYAEDPDEIPTIKLNIEEFTVNLQNYMQGNMELQEGDMSKALVAINPEAASIPTPKLKNVSRLRTEHQVYELPDSHPLLEGMDRREPDDPSPYLLAIWTPGETANSIQPPERSCGSQEPNKLCDEKTCFSCNSVREANTQIVRGTLLIPCRTAMRGSFPLNGTYFQVNEVFADHESSLNPINVPRAWIWNLRRRTVYFGTSVSTIFKGLSTEGIQFCFWKGFVCVRGFDQKTRAPRPLIARLHFPASKLAKTKTESKMNRL